MCSGARGPSFPPPRCEQGSWGQRCSLVGCGDGAGGAEGVSTLRLPGTRSRSPRHPPWPCLSPHALSVLRLRPPSCSSDTKLLAILHMLQAASHLGDFVAVSPLPGWHSLLPAQVNSSPPRAHWWDPDTHPAPACPPGSVTGVESLCPGAGSPAPCRPPVRSPPSARWQVTKPSQTTPASGQNSPRFLPEAPVPSDPPTAPTSPCAGPLPARWLQAVPGLP